LDQQFVNMHRLLLTNTVDTIKSLVLNGGCLKINKGRRENESARLCLRFHQRSIMKTWFAHVKLRPAIREKKKEEESAISDEEGLIHAKSQIELTQAAGFERDQNHFDFVVFKEAGEGILLLYGSHGTIQTNKANPAAS
jgi:hypothetical protein